MSSKVRITVFTPTYNRAYIIGDLYKSLKKQTYKDFEWVVVDDGSTDETESLLNLWIDENKEFRIVYRKVTNGGKHRAINTGVELASGDLFFIVDSDDILTDNALEIINKVDKETPDNIRCGLCGLCGVCGLRKSSASDQPIVGTTYQGKDCLDITILEREKYGITGDKSEVFYTDVMRKYPFPEFEGEKFVTECVVWDRMAYDGLKLRFFNEIIYLCEYRNDGLTNQGLELYANNPQAWGLYIQQSIQFGKLKELDMWNELLRYYYWTRNRIGFRKMSKYVNWNPTKLFFRLLGIRVFYKLYGIR